MGAAGTPKKFYWSIGPEDQDQFFSPVQLDENIWIDYSRWQSRDTLKKDKFIISKFDDFIEYLESNDSDWLPARYLTMSNSAIAKEVKDYLANIKVEEEKQDETKKLVTAKKKAALKKLSKEERELLNCKC